MKFIFPRNYNFKSKLFGFIDYQILIINIIFDLFVLCFCNLFIKNINIKIFIFICFCFKWQCWNINFQNGIDNSEFCGIIP